MIFRRLWCRLFGHKWLRDPDRNALVCLRCATVIIYLRWSYDEWWARFVAACENNREKLLTYVGE